ncbi:hypothetical protein ACJX0J_008722 [Zea mays]
MRGTFLQYSMFSKIKPHEVSSGGLSLNDQAPEYRLLLEKVPSVIEAVYAHSYLLLEHMYILLGTDVVAFASTELLLTISHRHNKKCIPMNRMNLATGAHLCPPLDEGNQSTADENYFDREQGLLSVHHIFHNTELNKMNTSMLNKGNMRTILIQNHIY